MSATTRLIAWGTAISFVGLALLAPLVWSADAAERPDAANAAYPPSAAAGDPRLSGAAADIPPLAAGLAAPAQRQARLGNFARRSAATAPRVPIAAARAFASEPRPSDPDNAGSPPSALRQDGTAQESPAETGDSSKHVTDNPATGKSPGEPTSSQTPPEDEPSPAVSAGTLVVGGVSIPYRDVRGGTTPDTGAGLWLGDDDTTDGSWGYFVGHNPGPFSPVRALASGDAVTLCGRNGHSRTYTVRTVFSVEASATWRTIAPRVTGYGESIILQTCFGDGATNLIAVAA